MKIRLTCAGLAVAAVAVCGPLAGGASAATQAVSHKVAAGARADATTYWTAARMRNAIPLDVGLAGVPAVSTSARVATGRPHALDGLAPGGATASTSPLDRLMNPLTFAYPFPFSRFAVAPAKRYKTWPWSVNGKVFFTQNGGNFVCSGTSVASATGDTVWTAGHCVNNGAGIWDSNAIFVPGYNGNAPHPSAHGKWPAVQFATSSAWNSSHDFSRDLGAMEVATDKKGRTLAFRVGTAGFAWNQARDQNFVDFGYPQAAPFDGSSMIECVAPTAVYDTGIGGSGPAPDGIGCDMTGGSSGGSWNIGWTNTTVGWINGHNDYKYGSQPLAMYSPYFDDTANAVRCAMANC